MRCLPAPIMDCRTGAHNENAVTLTPIHRRLHTICFRMIAVGLKGGIVRARRSVPDDRVAPCDRGSARTRCDTNGNEVPRRCRCWGFQFPAGITAGVNVQRTSARPDTEIASNTGGRRPFNSCCPCLSCECGRTVRANRSGNYTSLLDFCSASLSGSCSSRAGARLAGASLP